MGSFFLTTAIDYVNSRPHLGTAYEKITADVIARYHRLKGDRTWFLMGNDEHSQNVYKRALEQGKDPLAYCDEMEHVFREVWGRLDISFDDFIRTSDRRRHFPAVQRMAQACLDRGDIYEGTYEGHYCVGCEEFKPEKDLVEGLCPVHKTRPEWIRERNWFFRLSRYQQPLLDLYRESPSFIEPEVRRNEILRFVEGGLEDLSMSRAGQSWGIPLPFDGNYVTYVWFDALLNYYSAVAEKGLWPADFNVIGKDILVPPHAVYWPIMLHASGLPPPKALLVHGWWLQSGAKMSKSTGEAVNPLALIEQFGVDAFRYFLLREMNVGQDSEFTVEQFLVRYNSELANNLGNLVNRTLNMTTRFAGGTLPAAEPDAATDGLEAELQALWAKTGPEIVSLGETFQFHTALERTMAFLTATNAYIDKRAPWKLGKSAESKDQALLRTTLATIAEATRLAAAAMQHVTPATTGKIHAALGYTPAAVWADDLVWGARLTGAKVAEALVLFPRPEKPRPAGGAKP